MQTHLVPKITHKNLGVILRLFNYGKNSFIVLDPEGQKLKLYYDIVHLQLTYLN